MNSLKKQHLLFYNVLNFSKNGLYNYLFYEMHLPLKVKQRALCSEKNLVLSCWISKQLHDHLLWPGFLDRHTELIFNTLLFSSKRICSEDDIVHVIHKLNQLSGARYGIVVKDSQVQELALTILVSLIQLSLYLIFHICKMRIYWYQIHRDARKLKNFWHIKRAQNSA